MSKSSKTPLSSVKKYSFLGMSLVFATIIIVANISKTDNPGELFGVALAPFFWALVCVSIFRMFKKNTPMRSFEDQFVLTSFWLTIIFIISRISAVSN